MGELVLAFKATLGYTMLLSWWPPVYASLHSANTLRETQTLLVSTKRGRVDSRIVQIP